MIKCCVLKLLFAFFKDHSIFPSTYTLLLHISRNISTVIHQSPRCVKILGENLPEIFAEANLLGNFPWETLCREVCWTDRRSSHASLVVSSTNSALGRIGAQITARSIALCGILVCAQEPLCAQLSRVSSECYAVQQ